MPIAPLASRLKSDIAARWGQFEPELRAFAVTAFALGALIVALSGAKAWIAALCAIPAWLGEFLAVARSTMGEEPAPSVSRSQPVRIVLASVPAAIYFTGGDWSALGVVAVTLLALVPVGEPLASRVLKGQALGCAHLPGVRSATRASIATRYVMAINHLAIGIAIAGAGLGAAVAASLTAAILVIVLMTMALVDALRQFFRAGRIRESIAEAVIDYRPEFVVYYTAPAGSEYQIAMWLPYLDRIGRRYLVIVRSTGTYNKVSGMTTAPVVLRTKLSELDAVAAPSVKVAFYVNNGSSNAHFVRYTDITHIQLLHGESDKAASFNPVTAMFDKIFVAGQAGVDRYADHGVDIPKEKFVIVGRPQVEAVQPRTEANIPVRSVLYAPTWEGYQSETNYTSLAHGPQIVRALLDRGLRVVFRPHPFSYRNAEYVPYIRQIHAMLERDKAASGREHIWGKRAETSFSLFDCFNDVDALVSDVSSVIPDFLYSTKPFAIMSAGASDNAQFERDFPLARAGYVLEPGLANLDAVLDELTTTDSRADTRVAMRERYLGPFPSETYAQGFLSAARRVIDAPKPPADPHGSPQDRGTDQDRVAGVG